VSRHDTDQPEDRTRSDERGADQPDLDPDTASAVITGRRIHALAAIVPAHNEEDFLPDCLAALERAANHPDVADMRILLLVVADRCTDRTAAVAYHTGAHLALTEARNVGVARSVGAARAVEILEREGFSDRRTWLAYTDADTTVPPDWFARQLAYAAQGWSAVLGTVQVPDWSPRPPGTAQLFHELEARVPQHHRVHGANLGVRADVYRHAGGFPALPVGEDHALTASLRRLGFRVKLADDMTVNTSARISGRVDGGFSDYLTNLKPET
jgi:glycosyltransferase involved in cell wall biosynthesis